VIVGLRGEQDMSTAAAAVDALTEASTVGDRDVIVDLSEVQFMDAAIVTVLLRARHGLRSQSRDLTVRSPSSPARRVLDLCGLVDLIGPVPATARPPTAATTPRGWIPATRRVQSLLRGPHLRVARHRAAKRAQIRPGGPLAALDELEPAAPRPATSSAPG
jgi:anti-anti-sigma factor